MKKMFSLSLIALLLLGCHGSPSPRQAPKTSAEVMAQGAKIYNNYCSSCHQVDGTGVAGMQPSLAGDAVVNGDTVTLIKVILAGPAQVLPANRETYENQMPNFNSLSDTDVADVLSYIRRQWGNTSSSLNAQDVGQVRQKFNLASP